MMDDVWVARDLPSSGTTLHQQQIMEIPVEILTAILKMSIMDIEDTSPCRRLLELRSVCKHWHLVIDASPELWTDIRSGDPHSLVDKALTLSGTLPITVSLTRLTLFMAPFFEQLCHSIDRWEDVHLHLVSGSNTKLPLLAAPAPMIRNFYLTFRKGHSLRNPLPVDLFNGNAPRLRKLSINGMSLKWSSPIFLGLTGLFLCRVVISMKQLLQLLESMPLLESLHVSRLWQPSTDDVKSLPLSEITHHRLRLLRMSELDTENVMQVLTRLIAPECRSLDLRELWGASDAEFPPFLQDRLFASSPNTLSQGTIIRILYWFQSLGINAERETHDEVGVHESFDMTIQMPVSPWGFILWLEVQVNPTALYMEVKAPWKPLEDDSLDALASIRRLERLQIRHGDSQTVDRIMGLLSEPYKLGESFTWIFPMLTSLVFEGCGEAASILKMVKQRQTRNHLETGLEPLPPKRLEFLKLSQVPGDRELTSEFVDLLSPGTFLWD